MSSSFIHFISDNFLAASICAEAPQHPMFWKLFSFQRGKQWWTEIMSVDRNCGEKKHMINKIRKVPTTLSCIAKWAYWSSDQLSLVNERQEDWLRGRTETVGLICRKVKPLGFIISQSSFPTLASGSFEFPASHQSSNILPSQEPTVSAI